MRTWGRVAFAVSLVGTTSCDERLTCTDIGCVDQVNVELVANLADFPEGMHTVLVTADGVTSSCTFAFSPAAIADGQVVAAACPSPLSVQVRQARTCVTTMTTTRQGAVVGASWTQTCEPIPGKLAESITLTQSPVSLRVEQTADGAPILDRTITPEYRVNRPNGPRCEPTCHQASVDWTLP